MQAIQWRHAGVTLRFIYASVLGHVVCHRPSSTAHVHLDLGVQSLTVARVEEAHHHPGTPASHVTRLLRMDGSGVSALLEAEGQWHSESHDGTHTPGVPAFVHLSAAQRQRLREHHDAVLLEQRGVSADEVARQSALATEDLEHTSYDDCHGDPRCGGARATGLSVLSQSAVSTEYVGPVGIGTQRKPAACHERHHDMREGGGSLQQTAMCSDKDQANVWVVFDTGSTNIWINSDLCKAGACAMPGRARYSPKGSETYGKPDSSAYLRVKFGTGRVAGPRAVDDFHVGPFLVRNQAFSMIEEQVGWVFYDFPFEGILGLAFPSMAHGIEPFFDNVIRQKALPRNEFAFYLSKTSPSANAILWGGVDATFHEGPIELFNVSDAHYWSIDMPRFRHGDQVLLQEGDHRPLGHHRIPKAIVDTGTALITADTKSFRKIMAHAPTVPCDEITPKTHPPMVFTFRRQDGTLRDFELTYEQYMTQEVTDDKTYCRTAMMESQVPPAHGPAVILGEVFLRHFFAVFHRGDGKPNSAHIGFARAAHGTDVHQRLKTLTRSQPSFAEMHRAQ